MESTFGVEEIVEVMDSLLSGKVTMGEKVHKFEREFATYIGAKHAIMVNSGSSANLLLLSSLTDHLKPGDEIITPAVTWSTTVFPIYQIRCIPHFVDINPNTLTADIDEIESAINDRTKAIMHVHLLGSPSDMTRLQDIASRNGIVLIEDACEAHGAEWKGRKIGSFGRASTFSFFFSHHISTIEGGMILTDDDKLADILKSKRAHGWIRERSDRDAVSKTYQNIDPRFLFVTDGYNMRPTDLQGAIGVHQINKLDGFLEIRTRNAEFWNDRLRKYDHLLHVPSVEKGGKHAWFGHPLVLRPDSGIKREDLVSHLEKNKIETRPIMAGNITRQPALKSIPYRKSSALMNADLIHSNGVFIGNHAKIDKEEREFVADVFDEFFSSY